MKIKLSFILIIFFLSCQKEKNIILPEVQTIEFNILEAKNYYTDELVVLKKANQTLKKAL